MPVNKNESKELRFNTDNLSLSSASVKRILYIKPDGSTGYWTATLTGTKLIYTTVDGDLDQVGEWAFQPFVEFAGGIKWYGDTIIRELVIEPIL
jgi:hypothetical protein